MTALRTFLITFADTRHMRVELQAKSTGAALKAAERLYLDGDPNDPRFIDFGGDAFHDAYVEEVEP